jgi:hypothetical protein
MKYLLAALILLTTMNTLTLFDFENNANIKDWRVVDDVGMGYLRAASH